VAIKQVLALAIGGLAAGRRFPVDLIAGRWPLFLGLDGGNYVRDGRDTEHAVYLHWPDGAEAPIRRRY
jgi:hypothetical protein